MAHFLTRSAELLLPSGTSSAVSDLIEGVVGGGNDTRDGDKELERDTETRSDPREEDEELDGDTETCSVCWEGAPQDVLTPCCKQIVCKDCIKGLVNACVEGGYNSYVPRCVCGKDIREHMLADALSSEELDRLKELQKVIVESKGELEYAYCPRKGCETKVWIPANEARGRCDKCRKSFCALCFEPHGRMVPCSFNEAKHLISSPSYARNQLWKALMTKPCPKCKTRIQKNGGCSHMTCRHCNHYFCWHCGSDLNKHSVHCKRYWVAAVVAISVGAVVLAPITVPAAGVAVAGFGLYQLRRAQKRRTRRRAWSRKHKKDLAAANGSHKF